MGTMILDRLGMRREITCNYEKKLEKSWAVLYCSAYCSSHFFMVNNRKKGNSNRGILRWIDLYFGWPNNFGISGRIQLEYSFYEPIIFQLFFYPYPSLYSLEIIAHDNLSAT